MDEWIAQYAKSHQHPVNRFCHTLGIPMIAISVLLFAAALVSVGLLISLRNVKRCGPLLAGLVLGLLIALPQLGPVLEWGKESHRKVAPSAEGYQAQMASALKPVELARWVHPILHGAPWQSDASIADANVSTYWPAREWRGADPARILGYQASARFPPAAARSCVRDGSPHG